LDNKAYIGRFAPSPTGELHFGSFVTAVASYLQARQRGGQWLIRVEDIDPPREVAGSSGRILHDLKILGMESDQPVLFQSSRLVEYSKAAQLLLSNGKAFYCSCSRKDLPTSGIYPGTCRHKSIGPGENKSIRLKTSKRPITFTDKIQGDLGENLEEERGDFVIWRADGLPAYQLAVVIDDAMQGITEVVRGSDLIDSTCKQILLQEQLNVPTPAYVHLPVATLNGKKLSKRFGSDPISSESGERVTERVLKFLGHTPPKDLHLDRLWEWAVDNWDICRIPGTMEIPVDEVGGFQV
jgi:glutamyl-Q tRNA(Asp) synthetase